MTASGDDGPESSWVGYWVRPERRDAPKRTRGTREHRSDCYLTQPTLQDLEEHLAWLGRSEGTFSSTIPRREQLGFGAGTSFKTRWTSPADTDW
jgi:hypothetical protein